MDKNYQELLERIELLEKQVNGEHEVEVFIENSNSTLPVYAKPGDAGMDLIAAADVFLPMSGKEIVSSGIKISVPAGFEAQVRNRSGVGIKTELLIPNAPGTVDAGYRGVVGVIMKNNQNCDDNIVRGIDGKSIREGETGYQIHAGDRIAQIVLNKVCKIKWIEVEDINTIPSDRGATGFGDSGIR